MGLVAVLPAANTCALTAPASPTTLDGFHTSAPFSLASMATAGTTATGPYIQPQAAEEAEETAVARSDFMGTFKSPEQQPRFLIDVRYAHTGLTGSGSGTLQAVVGLHQNFLVPNGGAYMTIKLVGVIPAMTSFLVAVLPAANTCALTAPASPTTLDGFHTSAPFSLASMATAGTTATGEIVGVFTTGG